MFVQCRWHRQSPTYTLQVQSLQGTGESPWGQLCHTAWQLFAEKQVFSGRRGYKQGIASRSGVWATSIPMVFLRSQKHMGLESGSCANSTGVKRGEKCILVFLVWASVEICLKIIICWAYRCPVSAGSRKRPPSPTVDHSRSFSSRNVWALAAATGARTMSQVACEASAHGHRRPATGGGQIMEAWLSTNVCFLLTGP